MVEHSKCTLHSNTNKTSMKILSDDTRTDQTRTDQTRVFLKKMASQFKLQTLYLKIGQLLSHLTNHKCDLDRRPI